MVLRDARWVLIRVVGVRFPLEAQMKMKKYLLIKQ